MEIEELITTENIEDSLKPKTKKVEDIKYELTRKRDILATKALLEGLEKYIGEDISAAQIRNMKKKIIESYFMLYQAKVGQEVTKSMIPSLVEMSVKGVSYFVNFNSEEDLKKELRDDLVNNNEQVRRLLGCQLAAGIEKYGDVMAIFRHIFIYCKHITFSAPASTMLAPASTMLAPASTITDSASTITYNKDE